MTPFINRIYEKAFLIKDFKNYKGASRVLLITAESGIGKSSLIEKALDECNLAKLHVKIARHKNNANVEGLFVRQLAIAINDYSNANDSNLFSFVEFIKYKKVDIKKYISAAVADITRLKKISEQLTKDIGYESKILNQTLFYSSDSVVYEATKYIEYALNEQYFYVLVDNSQIIDSYSLNCFYRFLLKNKIYLILEYTKSEEVSIEIDALSSYFISNNIYLHKCNLKKLPLVDIITAFQNSPKEYLNLVKGSYEESSGNLHKLQMLQNIKIKQEKRIKYDEIDSIRIFSLNKILQLLMCGIALHDGYVSEELLDLFIKHRHFTTTTPVINTNELVERILKEKDLIYKEDDSFKIKHDSIISFLLKETALEKYRIISINIWLNIYRSLFNNDYDIYMPKYRCLTQLIFFSSKVTNQSEFHYILNGAIKLIPRLLSIERCIKNLEDLKERLLKSDSKIIPAFDKKLALIYYRTYNYKKAKGITDKYKKDALLLLINLTSMGLDGKIDDAKRIGMNIVSSSHNAKLKRGAIISLISSYRANNMIEEAKLLWNKHRNLKTFERTDIEPYFYKCADFLMYDDKERKYKLKFLKLSLKGFSESKNELQVMSTHISLARFYLKDCVFEKAEDELNKAKKISTKYYYKYSLVENNFAVLFIRKGNYEFNSIEEKLLGVLNNISNFRDRFIVLNNLLVLYAENQKQTSFEFILEEMETEKNREILDYELVKIFYYNAYLFYKSIKNKALSHLYYKKGTKIPSILRQACWNERFLGNTSYKKDSQVQSFKTINLVNWTFDFLHLFE